MGNQRQTEASAETGQAPSSDERADEARQEPLPAEGTAERREKIQQLIEENDTRSSAEESSEV